ncbi:MAG TPA: TraB/GumN family protein [Steroidobacteraceae bacterium]
MGRFICSGILLAVLGLLGSLSAYAESPVWAIKGAHNTVYLAGSVHLLRAKDSALPPAFAKAYADADALVMEIDMDDLNESQAQGWVLEHGMFSEEETLQSTLGDKLYKRAVDEGSKLGLPVEALQMMEPWLLAMSFAEMGYLKLGFDPEQGVEKQLARKAAADHKEITGFETVEEQFGLLDGLSYPDQARFLEITLEEMDEMETQTDDMLSAWRSGDAKKLGDLLSEEYKVAPTLYRTLVSDRNKRWMPQLEKLLTSDKDYLVVVGALHLVGNGGLLELTRARGYTAKQMP